MRAEQVFTRICTVALATALGGHGCSRPLPYELTPPPGWLATGDSLHIVQYLAGDYDGDGADELAVEAPRGLQVLDWDGARVVPSWAATLPAGHGSRSGSVQLGAAADLDDDRRFEIFVAATRDDAREWGVWVCGEASQRFRRLTALPAGPDDRADGAWDGIWAVGGVLRANAVAVPTVIVYARTGLDGSGRCVLALDAVQGHELWRFACGPNPERLAIADLDGDRAHEVIFTGNAQDNLEGRAINGTSDDVAMLFVLDACGALLWSRVLGGVFFNTHLQVADLDGDGAAEIVTATDTHGADEDDRLCVWNGRGALLAQRVLRAPAQGLALAPATGADPALIWVGGQDGVLRRLAWSRAGFAERGSFRDPPVVRPLLVADIAPDPGLETVTRTTAGRLHVLDASLLPLARLDDTRPPATANAFRPQYDSACSAWSPARDVTIVLTGGAAHVVERRPARSARSPERDP